MAVRKPLTAKPPVIPTVRRPTGGNLVAPNKPPLVKPTKPTITKPVVKPPTVKPNVPTKPTMVGGIGSGLLTGGVLLGGTTLLTGGAGGGVGNLFGLAGQGIQTAGTVAVAGEAIEAAKEIIGGITENPMNLAIVAGVIGAVLFLGRR